MSFLTIIIILGIIQSLFFGVIFFTVDRNNKKANRLLGMLLLLIGASITPILFMNIPKPPVISFIFKVVPDVRFLFGPFLYLYMRALVRRNYRFQPEYLLHFIPYYINGASMTVFRFYSYPIWHVLKVIFTFLCYTHVFIYSLLIIISINKHITGIKGVFSSIKNKSLSWLKYLASSFIVVFCFMTILDILYYSGYQWYIIEIRNELTALLVTLFVFSMGFLGLRQPDIFSGIQKKEKTKYSGSSLTQQMCMKLFNQLTDFMNKEKPYLDNELTIEKLADRCGIPDYHLSRIINEKAGMIFYDFINSYRIKEVQELLKNPKNERYTIIGLALDAGFNSKSAFYSSFKKFLKMTPVAYKQSL